MLYKVIFSIFLASIFFTPFYIFPSGLPQPNDVIAMLGIIILVLSGKIKEVTKYKIVRMLFRLTALICVINAAYSIYYFNSGIENTMYFVPLFYIYNTLFFCTSIFLFRNNYRKVIDSVAIVIMITIAIQIVFGIVGVKGSGRGVLFFNNPNQLGYFTLLALSIFTVLPSKYRANKLISFGVLIGGSYLILLSGSRAALAGVATLGTLIFIKEGFKLKASSIGFLLFGIGAIIFVINTSDFFQDRLEGIKARNQRNLERNVPEYQIRGYDRFLLYPEYVFYGAGEGNYARFHSYHQLEMHSGFGTILFSYGVLGLYLFFLILKDVIRRNALINFLLLAPVFIYNITHMGLRDSLFWLLLASVFIVSLADEFKNKLHKNV